MALSIHYAGLDASMAVEASAALNRLNAYMFAVGVFPDRNAPPHCAPDEIKAQLASGLLKGVIARADTVLAGIATYSIIPDPALDNGIYVFVSNIWVEEEWRRQGIACGLAAHIKKQENPAGIVCVSGETNPSRPYLMRMGFHETGLRFLSL